MLLPGEDVLQNSKACSKLFSCHHLYFMPNNIKNSQKCVPAGQGKFAPGSMRWKRMVGGCSGVGKGHFGVKEGRPRGLRWGEIGDGSTRQILTAVQPYMDYSDLHQLNSWGRYK